MVQHFDSLVALTSSSLSSSFFLMSLARFLASFSAFFFSFLAYSLAIFFAINMAFFALFPYFKALRSFLLMNVFLSRLSFLSAKSSLESDTEASLAELLSLLDDLFLPSDYLVASGSPGVICSNTYCCTTGSTYFALGS